MKRRLLVTAVSVVLLIVSGFGQEKPTAKSRYDELAAKLKAGDKSVDFKELRLAYADSPGGRDTDKQKKAMTAALNSKNYSDALKNADIVLAGDFADMDAHFVEYIANRELNHTDQAEFHKFIFKGLIDSILNSGDGKSAATAWQVVEVHEEYVVLRFLGLMPSKQSLSHKDGHSYDVMETVNPKSNEKVTLYFNIDIEEKHLMDALK